MKLLSFSGAATKIAAHVAHGTRLLKDIGYKPDILAGVSSGALVLLPLALGKFDLLKDLALNLKLSDIFGNSPVDSDGKFTFRAILRALNSGAFGNMAGLEKTIKRVISEEEFTAYRFDKSLPICLVGYTNFNTNRFTLVNLKEVDYDMMIKVLLASCSIPIYVPPVEINGYQCMDGGVMYHNPASVVLYDYPVTECVSVYSRPKDADTIDLHFTGTSLGRAVSKTFEILQDASSRKDEAYEVDYCKRRGIRLTQLFSPSKLKGVYDVDPERLKDLYDETYRTSAYKLQ